MKTILLCILVLVMPLSFSGCVFHFKAKEIETDLQRQRVERTYKLEFESVGFRG